MAKSESCRDLRVGRRPDTLMPVSPSREQISVSLSHDGEAAVSKDQEITMGDATQAPGQSVTAETRRAVDDDDDDGDEEGEEIDEGVEEARG